MGELQDAAMALAKSCELEPSNKVNKSDQRTLNDLKITDRMVKKAMAENMFGRAVTQLSNLLESCSCSINFICLKIECMLRDYKFDEAAKYSGEIMKKE